MLSVQLTSLNPGWFSGPNYGGGRQYTGPNKYFSTEGFPPEAYTMPPTWINNPETQIAQQLVAESVRGSLPVANTIAPTFVDTPKLVASVSIAYLPAEAGIPVPQTATAAVAILPIVFWLSRILGVGGTALGVLAALDSVLGLFEFGRIFVYIDGKSFGSMPPPVAWAWYYQLRQDRQRRVRLRMEGADKGGFSGAIPPYRGYDSGIDDGKSFLDKINPFNPEDSLGDKLNPFVIDPGYFDGSNPLL